MSIREDWIVAVEDLYGGFELVQWFEEEKVAIAQFELDLENYTYPDKEGRDVLFLKVIRRGEDQSLGESKP